MTTNEIHPAEPGAYWARAEDQGPYDTILFIVGKVPFLRIDKAVMYPSGEQVSGSFNIGPIIERPCIDEPATVEGGA